MLNMFRMLSISVSSASFCATVMVMLFSVLVSCSDNTIPENQTDLPKIIALGDMHGDYDAYEILMLDAGLMNLSGDWTGGDTIFVQTGDIPDRGPDSRRIIESLQRLEVQAFHQGGKVVPMIGNHEAMNVLRDLRYVHPGEYAAFIDEHSVQTRSEFFSQHQSAIIEEFQQTDPTLTVQEIRQKWEDAMPLGKVEHALAWSPDGRFGAWVSRNQAVAKIGPYLFAHGGFSREFSTYTLEAMNNAAQSALVARDRSDISILRHPLGPLWYRGNVQGREGVFGFSKEKELDDVLETYDATHIIIGHTRSEDGIRTSSDDRLIQIDTGASAYYGGVRAFLRIENGEFFAHEDGGVRRLSVD